MRAAEIPVDDRVLPMPVAWSSLHYKYANFPTYFISRLFRGGRLFWKVYVYFRWLDDIVDDPRTDGAVKATLLQEQRRFLERAYAESALDPRHLRYEERIMWEVIQQIREERDFKGHLLQLMSTFEFDVARFGGKRVSEDDFMAYSRSIGTTYAYVLSRLMGVPGIDQALHVEFQQKYGRSVTSALAEYSHYCHLVHVIRDFPIDQRAGYNNLPLEYETLDQFAAATLEHVTSKFKAIEYEHFFLLVKYRVSFFFGLVGFLYYSRFVAHLRALRESGSGRSEVAKVGLTRIVGRYLLNRFYYLNAIEAGGVHDTVQHRQL